MINTYQRQLVYPVNYRLQALVKIILPCISMVFKPIGQSYCQKTRRKLNVNKKPRCSNRKGPMVSEFCFLNQFPLNDVDILIHFRVKF